MFEVFHGRAPDAVERRLHRRIMPPVVVDIGSLGGLIYRSDKWTPGKQHSYIHMMERPPRLVCDPSGRQLYLLGGDYRVTTRGIEG